jgi:hypothetical protein
MDFEHILGAAAVLVLGGALAILSTVQVGCGQWGAEPRFSGTEITGTVGSREIDYSSRLGILYRPNMSMGSHRYRIDIDDILIGFPDDEPGTYRDNIYVRYETEIDYNVVDLSDIWCDINAARVHIDYRDHDLIAGRVTGQVCQSYSGTATRRVDLEFVGTVRESQRGW